MPKSKAKSQKRERRHKRIRAKISGTMERPRLSVFKSNTSVYAQVIDDVAHKTLASASGPKAELVGAEIARKAIEKGVKAVIFDRGGYVYTGKVRELSEAARSAGLKF